MMTAGQAATAVRMTVQPGTPEHAAACELCLMRGYNPNDPVVSVKAGIPQLANWQWILAEQILEQQLRNMIALQAGPRIGMPSNG